MLEKNSDKLTFILSQEDRVFYEKICDISGYNPITRLSIDVRKLLPSIIVNFQKTLSRNKYDTFFDVGNNKGYDTQEYYEEKFMLFPRSLQQKLKYDPKVHVNKIRVEGTNEEKTIRGVEFKIGLYINENTIVERLFYVNGFNPVSRYSYELYCCFYNASEEIFEYVRNSDIKNIWDDYDLINTKGFNIEQIWGLTMEQRKKMIWSIRKKY